MTIQEVITKYKYKPLPPFLSVEQRRLYRDSLPKAFKIAGDDNCGVYAHQLRIANGYNRVVIGDYGAFVEIRPAAIIMDTLTVPANQEYRFKPGYENIKYYWLCPKNDSDIKIYWQKHKVKYADYIPGMFYVSPYEIRIER